jgi:hypothetical protein
MRGALYQYLSDDHDRLDALLDSATAKSGAIDMDLYSEFRKGLLRHISIEEKIVLPAIARWQGGRKADIAERLRLDHSAIVSFLVPPPIPSVILTLRSILAVHNPLKKRKLDCTSFSRDWLGPRRRECSVSYGAPLQFLYCLTMNNPTFLK